MLKKSWNIKGYSDLKKDEVAERWNPQLPVGLVRDYVEDRTLECIVGCTNANIYSDYLEFCRSNNFYPMSKHGLLKGIRTEFGCTDIIRKIDGKSYRIMVPSNYSRGEIHYSRSEIN